MQCLCNLKGKQYTFKNVTQLYISYSLIIKTFMNSIPLTIHRINMLTKLAEKERVTGADPHGCHLPHKERFTVPCLQKDFLTGTN